MGVWMGRGVIFLSDERCDEHAYEGGLGECPECERDRYLGALREIADLDYRGAMSRAQEIARKVIGDN